MRSASHPPIAPLTWWGDIGHGVRGGIMSFVVARGPSHGCRPERTGLGLGLGRMLDHHARPRRADSKRRAQYVSSFVPLCVCAGPRILCSC